jgi:hypothetical protein
MSRRITTTRLDPQQLHFITTLLELGGGPQHGAEAALVAGYADDARGAERAARMLLEDPKIARALRERVENRFVAAVGGAFNTLWEICTKGRSETARITAAREILDRGIGPVPSRSFSMNASLTIEDILLQLDEADRAQTIDGRAREVDDGE